MGFSVGRLAVKVLKKRMPTIFRQMKLHSQIWIPMVLQFLLKKQQLLMNLSQCGSKRILLLSVCDGFSTTDPIPGESLEDLTPNPSTNAVASRERRHRYIRRVHRRLVLFPCFHHQDSKKYPNKEVHLPTFYLCGF